MLVWFSPLSFSHEEMLFGETSAVCSALCACGPVNMCVCVCVCMCVCVHVLARVCACVWSVLHTYIHTCVHVWAWFTGSRRCKVRTIKRQVRATRTTTWRFLNNQLGLCICTWGWCVCLHYMEAFNCIACVRVCMRSHNAFKGVRVHYSTAYTVIQPYPSKRDSIHVK